MAKKANIEKKVARMTEAEFWEEWERITKILRKAYKERRGGRSAWKFHHVTSRSGFYGRRY